MICLVSYLKLEKNMCAHFKSSHLLWVYMNEFSCTDKRGGMNYMFQPSRSQRLIDSASQTRPSRGQSPLFHRWGASTWPGLNDLPKVKQLTVSGLWHIPDLMNQILSPETPTNSIILQKWKGELQGMWGFAWGYTPSWGKKEEGGKEGEWEGGKGKRRANK